MAFIQASGDGVWVQNLLLHLPCQIHLCGRGQGGWCRMWQVQPLFITKSHFFLSFFFLRGGFSLPPRRRPRLTNSLGAWIKARRHSTVALPFFSGSLSKGIMKKPQSWFVLPLLIMKQAAASIVSDTKRNWIQCNWNGSLVYFPI